MKDGLLISGNLDLITREQFANFDGFRSTWKSRQGEQQRASFIASARKARFSYQTGPEMQITMHPAGTKINKNGGGAIFDLLAPNENALKPAAEWNTFKIVANGKHIEHWVNGVKVIDTDIGSDAWNKAIAGSKWKNEKLYASKTSGSIALQDYHGHRVQFRNIKIRVFCPTRRTRNRLEQRFRFFSVPLCLCGSMNLNHRDTEAQRRPGMLFIDSMPIANLHI